MLPLFVKEGLGAIKEIECMKISENWLRTWVNPAIDSDTLSDQLTMLGLEVDDMSPAAKPFTGVVVGEVSNG